MATTFAELKSSARSLADLGAPSSSAEDDFVTEAELGDWVNKANAKLYYRLLKAGLILRESTVDVVGNGGSEYVIGTNDTVFGIINVGRMTGQGTQFDLLERHGTRRRAGYVQAGIATSYRVFEGAAGQLRLELLDPPTYGTYRVWHVPAVTILVAPGDSIYYPFRWNEIPALEAAIRAKIKADEDPSQLRAQADELWKDIDDEAERRELNEGHVIENVDNPYRGYGRSKLRGLFE